MNKEELIETLQSNYDDDAPIEVNDKHWTLADLFARQWLNNGWDGLYPVQNNYVNGVPTEPFDGSPWAWWDYDAVAAIDPELAATQLTLNPTMGPAEANYWIDIIQEYTAPRLAASLDSCVRGVRLTAVSVTASCAFFSAARTASTSSSFAFFFAARTASSRSFFAVSAASSSALRFFIMSCSFCHAR